MYDAVTIMTGFHLYALKALCTGGEMYDVSRRYTGWPKNVRHHIGLLSSVSWLNSDRFLMSLALFCFSFFFFIFLLLVLD